MGAVTNCLQLPDYAEGEEGVVIALRRIRHSLDALSVMIPSFPQKVNEDLLVAVVKDQLQHAATADCGRSTRWRCGFVLLVHALLQILCSSLSVSVTVASLYLLLALKHSSANVKVLHLLPSILM